MGLAKRHQIIGAGMVVVVGLAVLAVPVLGSLLVAIALWAAAVLAMRSRASRHDGNALARLITWLALAKVVATLAAYCAFRFLYGGGDASFYDASGRRIAQAWASGQHAKPEYPFPGTATIEYLTGGLYLVVKPLAVSGYLLFSVAGFAGAYLWYRAIRIGAPDLEPRRLALLTLGLPTVLFWTSPISKDAVLMLALGAAAVGGSQLLTGRVRGALLLFVGLGFALTVRPHLAAMFAGSLGLAALFGRGNRRGRRKVLTKLVAGVLTIGAALFAISWFGSYSTLTGGESASEIQQAVQSFGQASGTGGSAFVAKPATSLTDIPQAVLNVAFRPSLLDVRNPLMLIAALESTYLLLFGFVGDRKSVV